jgi:hypothetical protein
MKKVLSMILFAATLFVASPTFAQSPNYSSGTCLAGDLLLDQTRNVRRILEGLS